MTQPSQNIQGNQGDVIGAGVAGSGNLLGKNITVQTVQGNVINLSLTPEVLNALDRVSQVPTEVQPKGPAGIQGNQVPQDLKGAEVAVNQLLDLLQRAGGRGQQPQVVQAGDVQVSKVDLLLKKAALLRMEAEQSVLDFVASNKDKLDEARERPGEVAKIVEQLDLNELMANFDPEAASSKLNEAYALLHEANRLDPANTEVLLQMGGMLVQLTPEDPTDERKVLLRAMSLLLDPKDDTERMRLAQAKFLLATSGKKPTSVCFAKPAKSSPGWAR